MTSKRGTGTAYLFVDTNICLHYQPFVTVPWFDLVKKPVCIVFCSTVVKELDRKKFEATQQNLRERAQKLLSLIEGACEGNRGLPKNTTVIYYPSENVDWGKLGLASDAGDDRIIGQVLRFKEETGVLDVRIVTADIGMRLKAKSFGIDILRLPDEYRWPVPDEAAAVRRELEKYKNRRPELCLGFVGCGDNKIVNRVEMQVSKDKLHISHSKASKIFDSLIARGISSRDAGTYLSKLLKYLHESARTIELRFVIENSGSAPAEDVEISLCVPALGVIRTQRPEPPEVPVRWACGAGVVLPMPSVPNLSPYGWGEPERDGDVLRLHYSLGKLKHQLREELEPLYMTLSEGRDIQPFAVEYEIRADNVPEPISGKLYVVLSRSNQ